MPEGYKLKFLRRYLAIQCDCGNVSIVTYKKYTYKNSKLHCVFCDRKIPLRALRILAMSDDLEKLRAWVWDYNRKRLKSSI